QRSRPPRQAVAGMGGDRDDLEAFGGKGLADPRSQGALALPAVVDQRQHNRQGKRTVRGHRRGSYCRTRTLVASLAPRGNRCLGGRPPGEPDMFDMGFRRPFRNAVFACALAAGLGVWAAGGAAPQAAAGTAAGAAAGARATGGAPAPDRLREAVRAYRLRHDKEIVGELAAFAALRNVANNRLAMADMSANAAALAAMLQRRGIAARMLEVPGSPPHLGVLRSRRRATCRSRRVARPALAAGLAHRAAAGGEGGRPGERAVAAARRVAALRPLGERRQGPDRRHARRPRRVAFGRRRALGEPQVLLRGGRGGG